LPQDYDRANYWYQKAATHGNTEAEYRLALIWAAGSAGFPRDIVEAYKWVALATESKGVWGSIATDLKTQLEKVMRPMSGRLLSSAPEPGKKPLRRFQSFLHHRSPAPLANRELPGARAGPSRRCLAPSNLRRYRESNRCRR